MNGQKAKALRRKVYGDLSLRGIRTYMIDKRGCTRLHPTEPRAHYQALKRGRTVSGAGTEERFMLPYVTLETERAVRRKMQAIFSSVLGGILGSKQELTAKQQGMIQRLASVFRPRRMNYQQHQSR